MRTIVILDGEAVPEGRGRPAFMAQADMVLTASGRILKSANGYADYLVDIEKLNSVLNGEKRVRKVKAQNGR